MGFGKSKAKMLTEKQGRVTFADVAGIDEAREELMTLSDDPLWVEEMLAALPG